MPRFKKVYVEITNVCNLSCSFCPKTKRSPQFMTAKQFSHLLCALRPYTDYIYLHLMGEPLLHPELKQMLILCEKAGMRVNITTNGTLIRKAGGLLLDAPSVRKVGFSLHCYEANRMEVSLSDYLTDVLRFVKIASTRGIICELRLWNADTVENAGANDLNGEILAEIVRQLGLPGPIVQRQGSVKLAERVFLGFNGVFDWPDPQKEEISETLFCRGLRDQVGVLADGRVVPCCLDAEGVMTLGNLYTETMEDILHAPRALAFYDAFSARRAPEALCKRCGYAKRFDL